VAWADALGFTEGYTAAEVAKKAEERAPTRNSDQTEFANSELRETLLRGFGERGVISPRRLGNWLASREGRIVDGHRFSRFGTARGGVIKWGVRGTGRY
jgi:hypothetical protein